MDCAENVTVHYERSRYRGCKDDPVGFARRHGYACGEVGAYRETVWLRRVLVADEDVNFITPLYSDDGPRVCRRSVAYAVVEP